MNEDTANQKVAFIAGARFCVKLSNGALSPGDVMPEVVGEADYLFSAPPVPPHAAGQEDIDAACELFRKELAEYRRGDGQYPSTRGIVRAMRKSGRLDSPAASQAALESEMPDGVHRWVKDARNHMRGMVHYTGHDIPRSQAMVWLADRVAELERELRGLECQRARLHTENQDIRFEIAKADTRIMDLENEIAALQSSAAKLPDTEKAKTEPPRPIASGETARECLATSDDLRAVASRSGETHDYKRGCRLLELALAIDHLHATPGLAESVEVVQQFVDDKIHHMDNEHIATILDALRCVYSPTEPST